jgi:hypothetical protein
MTYPALFAELVGRVGSSPIYLLVVSPFVLCCVCFLLVDSRTATQKPKTNPTKPALLLICDE